MRLRVRNLEARGDAGVQILADQYRRVLEPCDGEFGKGRYPGEHGLCTAPRFRWRLPVGRSREADPVSEAVYRYYPELREVASQTGGKYFTAPSLEQLAVVYSDLESRLGKEREWREVTVAFAAGGVLLLLLGGALSASWFRRLP